MDAGEEVCVSDGGSEDSVRFEILTECTLSKVLIFSAPFLCSLLPFISSSITLLDKVEAVDDLRGRFLAVCGFTTAEDELEGEEEEEEEDEEEDKEDEEEEALLNLSRLIVAGKRDDLILSVDSPLQSFFNCKK